MKNIKEEIRELERRPLALVDGVLSHSPEVAERLRYLEGCDPKPAEMYPRTMPASNGCAIRGCERLAVRTARFGYVNGHYHGDLCGDHSAAETALGR
jgi:hypothetical protein